MGKKEQNRHQNSPELPDMPFVTSAVCCLPDAPGRQAFLMKKGHPVFENPDEQGCQKPSNIIDLDWSLLRCKSKFTEIQSSNPKTPFAP